VLAQIAANPWRMATILQHFPTTHSSCEWAGVLAQALFVTSDMIIKINAKYNTKRKHNNGLGVP